MSRGPGQRTIANRLHGKTVATVFIDPFDDGRGATAYRPTIVFTDGSRLTFDVQETETDYGVRLALTTARP